MCVASQRHQAHPQVKVFGMGHGFVEAAHGLEIGARKIEPI
jgi:hypothetical protein